jgi:hypothetical protein
MKSKSSEAAKYTCCVDLTRPCQGARCMAWHPLSMIEKIDHRKKQSPLQDQIKSTEEYGTCGLLYRY